MILNQQKKTSLNLEKAEEAKPFLRWAGGKTWLSKQLHSLLPSAGFNDYHEPFLGGASIFLSAKPSGKIYLSDLNEELVKTYSAVKKNPERIIKELGKFDNSEEFYYIIRDKEFTDPFKKAARFIYLNQTSFNGIYRVNLNGKYNVPYGYRTKKFLEADKIRLVSRALKKSKIFSCDFEETKLNVKKKDLVFLDPPYTVSHNLNGFIKYNQKLFSVEDQYRLSAYIDYIKRKGAYYILTNAAHVKIDEIFEKGDRKLELGRASLIGGINAKRGKTNEYLFTNII